MRRVLLLFLKFPTPGRVKTRLAADLGLEAAAEAYRRLVARVLSNLRHLEAELHVVFDPPQSRDATEAWIIPLATSAGTPVPSFQAQCEGDLGSRLADGFSRAFDAGFNRVAAMGSDCIEITAEILESAWRQLEESDLTLGPTLDGGYYLIGTRSFQPSLFREIPWSTASTLSATLEAAERAGLSTSKLPVLSDVDTLDDWLAVQARLDEGDFR